MWVSFGRHTVSIFRAHLTFVVEKKRGIIHYLNLLGIFGGNPLCMEWKRIEDKRREDHVEDYC